MTKFDKTTAAVISGAIVAIAGVLFKVSPEILASVQVIVTAVLVWLVPNKS